MGELQASLLDLEHMMDGFGCVLKSQSPKTIDNFSLSSNCNVHPQWVVCLKDTAEMNLPVPCPHGETDDKPQASN